MNGPRVLVVGYSGANNTGAEALLRADIEDLRGVLGKDLRITIPALNPANVRRYVREGPDLEIVALPTIFFRTISKLVHEADVVVLVEGSAYMDTWTSALLWYFLWATHCADVMGKPCLAYAVDAGGLSLWNRALVRTVASTTDLIVTRSAAAADRLRAWGVTAPLTSTADNALTFTPDPEDEGWVQRAWPDSVGDAPVGLALVDFFRFPVVIRPWGRQRDLYRWPYYFASSPRRRRASATLAQGYARVADRIVEDHDRPVALIAMEELDETICRRVLGEMRFGDRARVFSSREHDASQMTWLLRSLRLLTTSRYHAAILALAGQIPQIAVGHDLRLSSLYAELGLDDFFLRPTSPEVFRELNGRIDALMADPARQEDALATGYRQHLDRAQHNRVLLRAFLADRGWRGAQRWAA
jgi:polysaccharide pyruvyl transferase WcaK-like protein